VAIRALGRRVIAFRWRARFGVPMRSLRATSIVCAALCLLGAGEAQSTIISTTMDGYFVETGSGFSVGDSFSLIFNYDDAAETDTLHHANGMDYFEQTYQTWLVGGSGSLYDAEVAKSFLDPPRSPSSALASRGCACCGQSARPPKV
jgi:hypothetical protein